VAHEDKADAVPGLRLSNVSVTYGTRRGQSPVRACRDVSIDVRRGEIFGLVGESGSGKTTIAQVAAGLRDPTYGSVIMDGRTLPSCQKWTREDRRAIQLVHQDPYTSLDPRQRIDRGLRELRAIHKGHCLEADSASLFARVGLSPGLLRRWPRGLSGGQVQRVVIARALLLRPAILIADEPTSSLDVSTQAEILDLVRALTESYGVGVLFITHDLSVARSICARVGVMEHGQIVEVGSSEQVFEHPTEPYTRALLSAMPGNARRRSAGLEVIPVNGDSVSSRNEQGERVL
jgi:ABC-type glutathione transport system ATPase component